MQHDTFFPKSQSVREVEPTRLRVLGRFVVYLHGDYIAAVSSSSCHGSELPKELRPQRATLGKKMKEATE